MGKTGIILGAIAGSLVFNACGGSTAPIPEAYIPNFQSPSTAEEGDGLIPGIPLFCHENQWWYRHEVPYGGGVNVMVNDVMFTLSYSNSPEDYVDATLQFSYKEGNSSVTGSIPISFTSKHSFHTYHAGSREELVMVELYLIPTKGGSKSVPMYPPDISDISNSGETEGEYALFLLDRVESLDASCQLGFPQANDPTQITQ
ncbi:hypothetical protein HYV12_00475 [Candidatus Dojkabacteria bacterium]|nr:hypothetical protein [Candidatus Dojkabacteria bacterium]